MSEPKRSLKHVVHKRLDPESMADEYSMDISASAYKRMKELGMKQQDLAEKMGVKPARVSRILRGDQKMTLTTLAKLEEALKFDLAYGFKNPRAEVEDDYKALVMDYDRMNARIEKQSKPALGDLLVGAGA